MLCFGGTSGSAAQYWNGSTWAVRQTAKPVDHKTLNAISCAASATCTAVGVRDARTSIYLQPVAEHG